MFLCGWLQDHELLPRGFLESGGGRQRRERLTEDQRKELRQMRKRHRAEHRKRKVLRLDDEGVSLSMYLPRICHIEFLVVTTVNCYNVAVAVAVYLIVLFHNYLGSSE